MPGIIISSDTGVEFESGAAEYISVARLDDTHFVVAYRDADDINAGKVVVGTITGTSISISSGDIEEFEAGEAKDISVAALSSSLFVISYVDDVDSDKVKARAGSVSGTTITLGAEVEVSANTCGFTSVAAFDGTYFVVVYHDGTNDDVSCRAGSISGTTITLGSEYDVVTDAHANPHPVSVATFNSTKFVVVYINDTPNTAAKIGTLTPSTKAIAYGAENQMTGILEQDSFDRMVAVFDSLHFIIFFHVVAMAGVYNEGTSVITMGSNLTPGLTAVNGSVCVMDSTHFIVSYKNSGDNKGYVRAGTLSGSTTITWDEAALEFDSDPTTYTGICNMDNEHFLVGFKETPA